MGGGQSVFDGIRKDDLIMAFFPCIYFCAMSQVAMSYTSVNYRCLTTREKCEAVLERSGNREYYFGLAVKMLTICIERGLRIVMENPWSEQTFLKANFIMPPSVVDNDRTMRGDFFKKPTAYWFVNLEPSNGKTYTPTPKSRVNTIMKTKGASQAGLCSEDRSMISPLYAHNFICDFIINQPTKGTQLQMF